MIARRQNSVVFDVGLSPNFFPFVGEALNHFVEALSQFMFKTISCKAYFFIL